MNKTQLIEAVAKDTGLSKNQAGKAVNSVIDSMVKALSKKGKNQSVTIIGFGTFSVRKRKARTGINPQTKAKIKIKASKTVGFKPGKSLKGKL